MKLSMAKQKTFTFSMYGTKIVEKGYRPLRYVSAREELKAAYLRQGYLIKDLQEEEVIRITCKVAKANCSLEERKELQKQIDNEK